MKRLKSIKDLQEGDIVYYRQRGKYKPTCMKTGYTVVREVLPRRYVSLAYNDPEGIEAHQSQWSVDVSKQTYPASPKEIFVPNKDDLREAFGDKL